MRRDNKKAAIVATLIVAVIGLSIGFAAYSSTLNISSKASVSPAGSMSVVFASSVSTSEGNITYQTNTTIATIDSGGAVSGTPTIDNTGNPTISNLSATFTGPG